MNEGRNEGGNEDESTTPGASARGTPVRAAPAARRRGGARGLLVALAAAGAVAAGGLALADRGERGDRSERIVERVGDRLELDDAQGEALRALIDTVGGLRETLRGDGVGDELRALVAGPTLDQAGALAMVESRADALRASAPDVVAAAAAFYDGLDESQRAEVDGLLERVGDGRRGRGWHR